MKRLHDRLRPRRVAPEDPDFPLYEGPEERRYQESGLRQLAGAIFPATVICAGGQHEVEPGKDCPGCDATTFYSRREN